MLQLHFGRLRTLQETVWKHGSARQGSKKILCNFSSWQVQVQELIQDVPVSVYSTGAVTGNCMKSKNGKFPLNMAIIKRILHFFHSYFIINKTLFLIWYCTVSPQRAQAHCKLTQSQMWHPAQPLLRPESCTIKVAAAALGELRSHGTCLPEKF